MDNNTRIIASSKNYIEDEALVQIKQAAAFEGVKYVVGLPDLHPGKGGPVGSAMITEKVIYPYFIGGDIGCGMRFSLVNREAKKLKTEKWAREILKRKEDNSLDNQEAMGTLGSGNHFAEFSTVEKIEDKSLFERFNLEKNGIYLLVHSGSRGLGNRILRNFVDKNKNRGTSPQEQSFKEYMKGHDQALLWAKENRRQIALKILEKIGAGETYLFESFHNFIERKLSDEGSEVFIHRKGAVSSGNDPVVIPGSRGDLTYLVMPLKSSFDHAWSLAHGAGRKWNRIKARQKSRLRYKDQDIRRIKGHALQVSHDRETLYEEVPEAYKDIDIVIRDLSETGLIKVIATFKPQLTCKGNL